MFTCDDLDVIPLYPVHQVHTDTLMSGYFSGAYLTTFSPLAQFPFEYLLSLVLVVDFPLFPSSPPTYMYVALLICYTTVVVLCKT